MSPKLEGADDNPGAKNVNLKNIQFYLEIRHANIERKEKQHLNLIRGQPSQHFWQRSS